MNAPDSHSLDCYRGAPAKIRQLDYCYPQLREQWAQIEPATTFTAPVGELDLVAMFKAAQALSGELVLGTLIERLMQAAVEHAGARRGVLILFRNSEPLVAAVAVTARGKVNVTIRERNLAPVDVPEFALRHVMPTCQTLVVDDASTNHAFSRDDYVRRQHTKSVVCSPILKQARLVGALYLENDLEPCVFTAERVAMLELLAAQAAISLENAYRYAHLQRREAFLAQGQKLSGTGSWRWNVATGALTWSDEQYRMWGCDSGSTVAPTLEWALERIHPEDRPAILQAVKNILRDAVQFEHDFRIVLADGTIRYLHTIGRPIIEPSGEIHDYVGATIDVSERKRSEDALLHAQSQLMHAARLTTMGELAANIAHEVNQPLASIVSNANACLSWLMRDVPNLDRARSSAERIVRDGHAAADVIRSIRAMLRKAAPERTPLDINALIKDVLDLMRGELWRHDIVLVTDLSATLGRVAGARVQIQQVIVNLVKNAVDAMSAVTQRSRMLRVETHVDAKGHVRISIEDSGVGIDPAKMHSLFEPFFTTRPDGMGLGLSICRSIVEGHGGRLWASPVVPHGSVFRFTLPALTAEGANSSTQSPGG